ncbi:YheC/YheD family endospore coat-associated protein [Bacillus sp. JJ1764]|uniref:YheC/YheD family endospore coat-associated protein n=1 Tax=Bacillus sp. JJ1764 TaxID=3122964 RepID=UPI002FFF8F28
MKQNVRPLIGIMTATKSDGTIAGNASLFKRLQKKLISQNGISFIFTLEGVGEDQITGYQFDPKDGLWKKEIFPFPDLVYNRIPLRKVEQTKAFHRFIETLIERKIPFFNPSFIDKYQLYILFKDHPFLKQYLPQTILVQQEHALFLFLQKHKSIYLKPASASKGKGIYRIKLLQDQIHVEGTKNLLTHFPSFQLFWQEWQEHLLNNPYLAQEDIHSAEYEGNRYDFRILVHVKNGVYSLTGIGIRQSQDQGITTHIPAGGKLLPYHLIRSSFHEEFIERIIEPIGEALTEKKGYFGEFSIDAGISKNGKYYIYEVNSKPMSFDEPEIEEVKIERLCQLFQELTKFRPNQKNTI